MNLLVAVVETIGVELPGDVVGTSLVGTEGVIETGVIVEDEIGIEGSGDDDFGSGVVDNGPVVVIGSVVWIGVDVE